MDFRVPELGEGVYEAEVIAWQVKVGEVVKRGQTLVEVMTDKATMEIPSPFAGTITSLNVEPDKQIKIGELLLSYEGESHHRDKEATPVPASAPARSDKKPK